MTDAYVHATVQPGAVTEAARAIRDLEAVETAHLVTGEYDVIAQVEVPGAADLPDVVADRIHEVTGVVDTRTNVAFEP